jgi:hypothetical protein
MIEPYYLGEFLFLVQKTVILNKKSKKTGYSSFAGWNLENGPFLGGAIPKAMLAAHMV